LHVAPGSFINFNALAPSMLRRSRIAF